MVRLFNKHIKQVGLAPGTLLYNGQSRHDQVHISVIEYAENQFLEKNNITVEECLQHFDSPSMCWIQIDGGFDPKIISNIGQRFKLHPLVLEDILTRGQRPKIDVYEDQVFIILRLLRYIENSHELRDEQISIVFGNHYLISFSENSQDIFEPIKKRLQQEGSRMQKQKEDYLAYALIDLVVDYYFTVLEKVDIALDKLEEDLVRSPLPNALQRILQSKKEMIILRKTIWPMREVINQFMRLEPPLVETSTQVYMHDVYDHTIQTIDIIEGFRDIVSGLMDIYLSNINIRTNEIMRVLTIVSTIFVPMTFITSLYGMNFDYIPELHYAWGYPIVVLVMVMIALTMIWFFHRRKWI